MDIKINGKDKRPEEEECCDYVIIAIDSTGIKVTNRGQWMNKKWNVRNKGYLRIHVAVDIQTKKIPYMEVTDEHIHDDKMLFDLVDEVLKTNIC